MAAMRLVQLASVVAAATVATCWAKPVQASVDQLATWVQQRRLNADEGSFSAACLEACPGLSAIQNSMPSGVDMSDLGGAMETMMSAAFNSICDHRSEFQCYVDNLDACQKAGEGLTADPFSIGVSHMGCLCDTCPSVKAGYAKFIGVLMETLMSAFSGLASQGEAGSSSVDQGLEMESKMLQAMCYLADGMTCIDDNTDQCDASLFTMFSMGDLDLSSMMSNTTGLKQECVAKGFSTSASDGEDAQTTSETAAATWVSPGLLALGAAVLTML